MILLGRSVGEGVEPTLGEVDTRRAREALSLCKAELTQLDDEVVALYEEHEASLEAYHRCERGVGFRLYSFPNE